MNDMADGRELRLWPRMIVGAILGVVLIGGIGGWAMTAPMSGAVITQGVVAVEANVQMIQHRDGGIVAEIAVIEGQFVDRGQLLLRLDDTQIRAELGILVSQYTDLVAHRARLIAERDGLAAIDFPQGFADRSDDAATVMAGEIRLFEGQRQSREQQKQQLALSMDQTNGEIAGLKGQLVAKQQEIDLVEAEYERTRALVDRNLAEASRLYGVDRERVRMHGEYSEIESAISRSGTKISELQLQIIVIDENARTDAQRELSAVETRLNELAERTTATEDRLSRTEVRSPIAGTVNDLNIHTIGGVVSPAEVVVTLVPEGSAMRIEVKLPPSQIEQVSVDQQARLRFTSFNSATTPELIGTVSLVAPATTRDPATGEQFYRGYIKVSAEELARLGDHELLPGMPVEVFVQTEERTFASYIVKPLIDRFSHAFRER